MLKQLTKYNILSIEQYGFRIGLKICNAIYKLTTEILNAVNKKLLVGGILCNLEEVFDCVEHGILLSKLNFYGISGNIIRITGIVEQQYAMTAITVIKFQAGPKLDMESQKALFWDLCFYSLYK